MIRSGFLDRRAGNTELPKCPHRPLALLMKLLNIVSVKGTPAVNVDIFQLSSPLIGTFKYSPSLGIGDGRQNGDHYLAHFTVGTDLVIDETNGLAERFLKWVRLQH